MGWGGPGVWEHFPKIPTDQFGRLPLAYLKVMEETRYFLINKEAYFWDEAFYGMILNGKQSFDSTKESGTSS